MNFKNMLIYLSSFFTLVPAMVYYLIYKNTNNNILFLFLSIIYFLLGVFYLIAYVFNTKIFFIYYFNK